MNTEVTPQYPEWVTTESEKKLHDDFRAFLWFIWRHLGLPNPTPRQLRIAGYIQHGPKRRMVQAWRGAAKTWITCAYALWRLYRNPQERVKIISANEDKAVENATFIRRLIEEVQELQFLRPGTGQRDSVLAFDVGPSRASVTPSVSCLGITGQLTGGRATILISDDVEVPKNSYTETQRERLAVLVEEYDSLIVPEGFDIIILGTPQTEESVYRGFPERGYDVRIWPVRYPTADKIAAYKGLLAPDILEDLANDPSLAGHSVEPGRFTDLDLAQRELSQRSTFMLQFMLDTSMSDAERYPLKLSDLIVMDFDTWRDEAQRAVGPVSVQWASGPLQVIAELQNCGFSGDRFHRPMLVSDARAVWQGCVMVIDPSGRGKDETAYAIVRSLNGMLFLVASGGFASGYEDDTMRGLADLAKKHAVKHILIESDFGDGMFQKLFEPWLSRLDPETSKPFYPCTCEEYRAGQAQKERRIIDDLEPVLNQHRLVVETAVVKADLAKGEEEPKYSLFYQLTHVTKERGSLRHDDRLDALAVACRYFREQLGRDAKSAQEEHDRKLKAALLDQWMKDAKQTMHRPTTYQRAPKVLRAGRRR